MSYPRQIREVSRALIEVAAAQGAVTEVIRDLKLAASVFRSSPDLAVALQDQGTALNERQSALQKALHDDIHVFVINALLELQRLRFLDRVDSFAESSVRFASTLLNHHDAVVYSAVKLEGEEADRIKKILEKKFGGKIGFEERVEPKILGGLVVEVGGWRFDDSLKEHASQLKQKLSA